MYKLLLTAIMVIFVADITTAHASKTKSQFVSKFGKGAQGMPAKEGASTREVFSSTGKTPEDKIKDIRSNIEFLAFLNEIDAEVAKQAGDENVPNQAQVGNPPIPRDMFLTERKRVLKTWNYGSAEDDFSKKQLESLVLGPNAAAYNRNPKKGNTELANTFRALKNMMLLRKDFNFKSA